MPLRADVETALRAALEEDFQDRHPDWPLRERELIVDTILEDSGAGARVQTVIRAMELLLDRFGDALPSTTSVSMCPVPDCQARPLMCRAPGDGTLEWKCADGHTWVVPMPKDQLEEYRPREAQLTGPPAGLEMAWTNAALWLEGRQWNFGSGVCQECDGWSAEEAERRGHPLFGGHKTTCGLAASMRVLSLEPLMRRPVDEEVSDG